MEPATYAGDDANGNPLFDLHLNMPDAELGDLRASLKQREAVASMLGIDTENLTSTQAYLILSARDYGRLVAERLYPTAPRGLKTMIGKMVALYALGDDQRAIEIGSWNHRRWQAMTEGSNIARTKHFASAKQWIVETLEIAKAAGAKI